MTRFTRIAALSAAMATLTGFFPARATAQISRAGESTPLHGAFTLATHANEVKGMDVAYDPRNNRYLVVTSFGQIYGVFVNGDTGAADGSPFLIPRSTAGFPHYPRVEYSPDLAGGAGGFLLTWAEFPTVQVVALSPSGVASGPQLQLWEGGIRDQAAPAVAYSRTSRRFLVAWQTNDNAIISHLIDVAPSTGLTSKFGGPIPITNPQTSRDPGVAWDSITDQFGISYTGWDSQNALAGFVRLSPSGGSPMGRQHFGHTSQGTYMSDVEFNPATGRYVMLWTNNAGTNHIEIDSGSQLISSSLVSIAFGGTDNLGMAFNPVSGTFLAVGQPSGRSWFSVTEIVGVELNSTGVALTEANLLTSTAPTKPTYYPRVAASTRAKRWHIAYNYADQVMMSQAITTASTGSGGGTTTPPPPPPPSCSVGVSPSAITAGSAGGAASVNVSGTCAWTASSGAGWMTITSGASGNGTGMVGFAIARNTTGATRSGTLTVGGTTVTIQQPPFIAAATHDVSGDGFSDLVWHNHATGQIAAWNLYGPNVTSTYFMNGGRAVDTSWKLQGSGDLNGDGHADLLWRHTDGRLAAWMMSRGGLLSGSVLVWPGGVTARQSDPNWLIRGIGDLDGNGRSDLIWQHASAGTLAVWFMDGLNILQTSMLGVSSVADPDWRIAGAGDINADGRADLIWQHAGTGRLAAWMMRGATVVAQRHLSHYISDLNWSARGVGDVNGDGYADLLWQNTATGGLGVWYLSNFTVTHQYGLSLWGPAGTDWHVLGPG